MQAIRQYLFRICFLAICAILIAVIVLPIGLAKAETGEEVKHQEEANASEKIQAQININVAMAEELMQLKGIGEVLAQRIIEYREQNGPFEKVEDILNVKGIGQKILEDNLDMMTLGEEAKTTEENEE